MSDAARGSADLATLVRWQAAGGEWRVLSLGPPVQVGLFTCDGGEEMGRIESTESPFVAYVEARSKQIDANEHPDFT
jgi:hypothetical protein